MLLAVCTVRVIPAFLFEGDAQRLVFAPHFITLLLISTVCVAITTMCGMMPLVATVTDRPWIVLKRESGSPSKKMAHFRSALVVGQIAMCCVLVIFTGVLLESLHSALKMSAGERLGDQFLQRYRHKLWGKPTPGTSTRWRKEQPCLRCFPH